MPCALPAQGISYDVQVRGDAARAFHVRAEFPVAAGEDTLRVALPAWTPGSYEIMNFARYVHGFTAATAGGRALFWDKQDKDTWRIATGGADAVVVEFDTDPDSVALELSRIEPGFALLNGANLFPYPVGGAGAWTSRPRSGSTCRRAGGSRPGSTRRARRAAIARRAITTSWTRPRSWATSRSTA